MTVASFVLAAAQLLAPNRDASALLDAIVERVEQETPLFANDGEKRLTAAWLVAVAFRESSLRLDAVGDHGHSFCAFQIHETSGGSATLLTDARACVAKGFEMLRTSMRLCPSAPLAWYAAGGSPVAACASMRAQRISRDRMALAKRLTEQTLR